MSEIEDQKSPEIHNKDEKNPRGQSDHHDPRFTAPTITFIDSKQIIGTEIGHYQILSVLGEGGGGIVYLAQQNNPIKRRVALKVIKPGMDSKQVIARFEAERQALALLDHPNIAHVYDGGSTQLGLPYFVMEYVRGIPITEYCDHYKMQIPQRLELFILVCEAIHHAHQKGILHRDIKPSNILVSTETQHPIPKVIDFGVAKALGQPLTERTLVTQEGQFIGTPEYMSPEQANLTTEDVDTRSDIYSLGVVLYELLTGLLPFDSATLREKGYDSIRRVITEQEPKTLSARISDLGQNAEPTALNRGTDLLTLTRSLRRELEWIPLKAMRKDRTRRYRSAIELADDIRNYLNGVPLIAGPETATYRIQKFAQKYRAILAAVVTIIVVLAVGVLISTAMYVRAQKALNALTKLENKVEKDETLITAERQYAEGRYEKALEQLQGAMETSDRDPKTELLKAQLLFELRRYEETKSELQKLLDSPPEIAGAAHYLLARIALPSDRKEAEKHEQLAMTMLPETAEAYTLRALTAKTAEDALRWLSEAIKLDPSHYRSRKARALTYYGLGRYQDMQEDIGALISLRPQDFFGYALRAIAFSASDRFNEAIENHNRAIQLCRLASEIPELISQRRETYMRFGKYAEALTDSKQCVSLEPDNYSYHLQEFIVLLALNNYDAVQVKSHELDKIGPIGDGHRRLGWWSQKYVFDSLRRNKQISIPENYRYRYPYPLLNQAAECYKVLVEKGKPISTAGWGMDICWSPDGTQIAYGGADRNLSWVALPRTKMETVPTLSPSGGIEILNISSGIRRLLTDFGNQPEWSPDGRYIAFEGDHIPGGIWLIPAEGGQPRKIASGSWPNWSCDSKRIFFRAFPEGAIYSVSIDVQETVPIKILDCSGSYPGMVSISRDDKYIAVDNSKSIEIFNLQEKTKVAHWDAPWPFWRWALDWSPDGKKLIMGPAAWYTKGGIWIYDLEQRNAVRTLCHPIMQAFMSPDGTKLLLGALDSELWLVEGLSAESMVQVLGPVSSGEEYLDWELTECNNMIEAEPQNAEFLFSRAFVYIARKEYATAKSDLETMALCMSGSDGYLFYKLSWWANQYCSHNLGEAAELLALQADKLLKRFPGFKQDAVFDPVPWLEEYYSKRGKSVGTEGQVGP